eukprot:TRINITY_DN1323_c0_g2_i2.p1 TRINITY_DN1323_c0_g2~~TRINITY_DN1323_c0_g2_i2.p1  ORF type:complete len:1265 (-),score=564.26 TRINITY_DN1323_c0_g2_i2:67-3558(-)
MKLVTPPSSPNNSTAEYSPRRRRSFGEKEIEEALSEIDRNATESRGTVEDLKEWNKKFALSPEKLKSPKQENNENSSPNRRPTSPTIRRAKSVALSPKEVSLALQTAGYSPSSTKNAGLRRAAFQVMKDKADRESTRSFSPVASPKTVVKKRSSRDVYLEDSQSFEGAQKYIAFSLFEEGRKLTAREMIVKEIVTTERSYLKTLNHISQVHDALRKEAVMDALPHPQGISHTFSSANLLSSSLSPKEGMIVTVGEIKSIFSNAQVIQKLSEELLKDLEDRAQRWSPNQRIGNIFIRLLPFLKVYTEYCINHAKAQSTVEECKKRASWQQFMDKRNKSLQIDINYQDLSSLIISPIQRIPRYILLLNDLLKNTPEDHCDRVHIKESYDKFKNLGSHLNESLRIQENAATLCRLSDQIPRLGELIAPHRRLIRQATMPMSSNSGKTFEKRCVLLLFNDIVVLIDPAENSSSFLAVNADGSVDSSVQAPKPCVLVATSALCIWTDDVMDCNIFHVSTPEETFVLAAENEEEKAFWLRDINTVTIDLMQLANSSASELNDSPNRRMSVGGVGSPVRMRAKAASKKGNVNGRWSTYTYLDGSTYEGGWSQRKRVGYGVYQSLSGIRYEGEFDDVFNGIGTMVFPNGDNYTGSWVNGTQEGNGSLIVSSGIKFTGSFVNGRLHGDGSIFYGNGDVFTGFFEDGLISTDDSVDPSLSLLALQALLDHLSFFSSPPVSASGNGQDEENNDEGEDKEEDEPRERKEEETEEKEEKKEEVKVNSKKRKLNSITLDDVTETPLMKGAEGLLVCNNGDVYRGSWKRNKRNGNGISISNEKTVMYAGQWKDDERNGSGNLLNKNTLESYKGEWKGNQRHGTGQFISVSEGIQYTGSFSNDLYDGQGTLRDAKHSSVYEGNFVTGKREGSGKSTVHSEKIVEGFVLSIDTVYEGEWKNDRRNGKGTLTVSNRFCRVENGEEESHRTAEKFEGEWRDDLMEGSGVFTLTKYNGDHSMVLSFYEGEFKNGLKEGNGTLVENGADGSESKRYQGNWTKGKRNGHGKEVKSMGTMDETYEGNWVEDVRQGEGTLDDGLSHFSGSFVQGKRHGKGVLTANENVVEGEWKEDLLEGQAKVSRNVGNKKRTAETAGLWSNNQMVNKAQALPLLSPSVPIIRRGI